MSSGWEIYQLLIGSVLFGAFLYFLMQAISFFLRKLRSQENASFQLSSAEPDNPLKIAEQKIYSRFFLALHSASLLALFGVLLLPSLFVIKNISTFSKTLLFSTLVFLMMALIYAVRKGDLSWLNDVQKKADE